MNVGLMEITFFTNKSNLNFHNQNLISSSSLSTSSGFGSLTSSNFDSENFTSQDIEITDPNENCVAEHKMFSNDILYCNSGDRSVESFMDAEIVLQNAENTNWRSNLSSKDLSLFEFKQLYSRQNSQNCQLWQFLLGIL